MKIGIISDTHGTLNEKLLNFLEPCQEIWHAGDIGNELIFKELQKTKKLRAVYGNIDGTAVRMQVTEYLRFEVEGLKVIMTHIGGYPGHYQPGLRNLIEIDQPGMVVCGHSHILKVVNDPKYKHLHVNPGAAGDSGFHRIRTAVRFELVNGKPSDMEIWELPRG